jgi:hypothetical protein
VCPKGVANVVSPGGTCAYGGSRLFGIRPVGMLSSSDVSRTRRAPNRTVDRMAQQNLDVGCDRPFAATTGSGRQEKT